MKTIATCIAIATVALMVAAVVRMQSAALDNAQHSAQIAEEAQHAWDAKCRQYGGVPVRPYRSTPQCVPNTVLIEVPQ